VHPLCTGRAPGLRPATTLLARFSACRSAIGCMGTDASGFAELRLSLAEYRCGVIGHDLLKGFEPPTRRWLKVSFFLGIGLLIIFVWLDAFSPCALRAWWHGLRLGYSLNILATFTGFLIGVPVTVVVIDRFKSNLAEKLQIESEIASVNRISKAAWEDFSKAIDELCSDERVQAVTHAQNDSSATDQVQAEHDLIIERLEASRTAIRGDPNSAMDEIAELKGFLATHSTAFEEKRKAVDEQFGTRYTLRRRWTYIISLWRVLDEHVRVRRIEFKLAPMSRDSYESILDKLTSNDDNDLFGFLDVHSGAKSFRGGGITAMADLQSIMDVSLGVEDEQLANLLAHHYDEWIGSGLKYYWTKAFAAHMFLTSLKMTVQSVTKSGWPVNATRPS
jgi:hypothetical protein